MKKILFTMLALSALILLSCNKDDDGGSNAKVTFRKANISGAGMLALAQGGAATKAEGDVSVGPNALYTVSADGSMVQVTYNVDVEGADGEVAETIKANLIISPGFVFPVGEGWLWLANCYYDVAEGWENCSLPHGPERNALSTILNDFNNAHHDRHGAHYLVRKSDGALFEWTLEAGAPDGMDDGFKQPTFLNGWFHQQGKNLFVRTGGWAYDGAYPNPANAPSLVGLMDKGNTLDAVNILGDNISCWRLCPASDCLGGAFSYPGMNGMAQGILAPPSYEPVLLQDDTQDKRAFLVSIGGKLYLVHSYHKNVQEGEWGKDYESWIELHTEFYNLNVTSTSIQKGSLIWSSTEKNKNGELIPEGTYISAGETLSWWNENLIYTFDPKAATVSSRTLPAHYPGNEDEYVNGVAYVADGTSGFWECDLSKDAAEYVTFDWSSAADYQSKIVPGSLRMLRFEAASLTLQFVAYMTNGTQLNFYTSVTGSDRGVIKTSVGSDGNAGMVVTTMVRLN